MRLGAGEQGRAFVDLIERIGADHQGVVLAIDHGLGKGEQRFAGAIDRQHMARGVQPAGGHAETALAPVADCFAQRRQAEGGGVHRQLFEVAGQRFSDKRRRAVLGFANRQGNGALVGSRLHAGQQRAQFLERVGLQVVQSAVHRWCSFLKANRGCAAGRAVGV